MKLTVKNTVKFSLVVQLITGIITLYGLFITLDEKHNILRGILSSFEYRFTKKIGLKKND